MKRNLYGKKMFIADLLIVSLWALFAWHCSWGRIVTPVMILLRITLSFMIYRKSRWAFSNAVFYAAMFIGIIFNMPSIDVDFDPIGKIAYVSCYLFGFSDWAIEVFDLRNHVPIEAALYTFWGIYMAWLILMPIICTWNRKGIIPILKHKKKIWWYIGAVLAFFIFAWFYDKDSAIFIGGLLLSLTPLAYRAIYRRERPSILQSLVQNKILMYYISIASVLFSAVLIGLYEVNGAKPFAAFILPIILYVIEVGYIIDAYNKASSVEGGHEAVLVKFIDGKLKKLPWVTKSDAIRNSVGCYYDIPDWYFTTDGLGWDWVMSFDKDSGTLYVPEDEMVMTDHYELFRYTDGKMRHVGYGAGFWLHPSLHDFNYLAGIYQTDTNLIRIDKLGAGEGYRYASWQKSESMSSKPDLILYGGKAGIVENAIVFKNGNYTYIVPDCRRGESKDFGKVIIKHKDKVIYESEV